MLKGFIDGNIVLNWIRFIPKFRSRYLTAMVHTLVLLGCAVLVIVITHAVDDAKRSSLKARQSFKSNPPNILEILVDDLGYGDTSLPPFTGLDVNTPNLVRMASKGMILTNYHTAAATCTPTRASILTGVYPWRLGIKAVFEYGPATSDRNNWLPPVPTIPMVLREANYSVFHSGKWHLGGMRNDDWALRQLPEKTSSKSGGRRCPHPGPNQQGFKNYVSMLDGPGAPRQNRLQIPSKLYSQGCSALLHNDVDIGQGEYNITGYLSYCEAQHAIEAMSRSVAKQKPFFVQLWFHAPHAPYEGIPGYPEYLKVQVRTGKGPPRVTDASLQTMGLVYKYRSMIADMDRQLGRILDKIEALGIEKDTLIVFTSDNGPENSAGTTAGFRGRKRSLYEGGIRVPAVVQWVGTIPAGTTSDIFAVSTDLFPTFLDAAGVPTPSHLHLDGLSLLPSLVPSYYNDPRMVRPVTAEPYLRQSSARADNNVDKVKDNEALYTAAMCNRVTLWHSDFEGPRRTAAWIYDFKVLLDENEQMREMYDMRTDRFETNNLLGSGNSYKEYLWFALNVSLNKPGLSEKQRMAPLGKEIKKKVTLDMIQNNRDDPDVHLHVGAHMFKLLQDFARGGNAAHAMYIASNPGWLYPSTVLSDYRSDFIVGKLQAAATGAGATAERERLLASSCGTSPCTCEVKVARNVPALPFEKTKQYEYLSPGRLLNGAKLLAL